MRRAPGSSRCPPRTSPQRLGQGPWSDDLVSASLCALILWFAWVVHVEPTADCIDTDLPTSRGYSGQSGKPLIEIAHEHNAMWLMFTETRCRPEGVVAPPFFAVGI